MKRSPLYALAAVLLAIILLASLSGQRGRAQKTAAAGGRFGTNTRPDLMLARNLTWRYMEDRRERFGLSRKNHMRLMRVWVDELAMAHVHVQQTFADVPVFGGELIFHWNPDATLFGISNSWRDDLQVDTNPNLTADDAVQLAVNAFGCSDCLTARPESKLWVLRRQGVDRLTYQVKLRREEGSHEPSLPVYFVDAHTGEVAWNYDNLQSATGSSLYSGTVSFNTFFKTGNSTYYLEDLTRKIGTYNYNNGTSTAFSLTDTNDVWDAAIQRAAVDVHYGLGVAVDYFKNVHGRNGIDGNGGPGVTTAQDGATRLITGRVHYSSNYVNAFWNGSHLTFGDGDGTTASPLVTLDIVGHELTHGVTERTAGLVYSGESGALNESMSDVFGAMIERYARGVTNGNTWKVGEDCWTPATAGDALRYMDNPHLASNSGFTADDDPDHYSERYTGGGDNGGVHINSGIPNKVFYLLAAGGTHHRGGSMTGIGVGDAERIWYKALSTYMTSSTNFAGARTATLNAATALFGSNSTQANAVAQAWALCGVGTFGGGTTPPPTGGELLVNGGLESSQSPWVLSGTGAFYTSNGGYPQAGTGYLYFGTANSVSGAAYQQFAIPSTAASANLTFFLNVTSGETTTTTQYDRLLVEVRNTSGTLLATLVTYSNLNKGTAGVYSKKGGFSLLGFKGQTVRLQFRVTTDSSLPTTFRVDTVSVK